MRTSDAIRIRRGDGWIELPRRGTWHRPFKHLSQPGTVTVPDHKGRDLTIEEIVSIEKQSGVKSRRQAMTIRYYRALMSLERDGSYGVVFPELPGCVATATTSTTHCAWPLRPWGSTSPP
jgi:predicted RNA binding protein YcfA (HicA-like mRNA interferase family)